MIQNFFYCRENGCTSTPLSEPAPATLAEAGPVEETQATVIDPTTSNGRKQDVGVDRTPSKERVGSDRASSSKETKRADKPAAGRSSDASS